MRLADYLRQNNLSQYGFAKELGVKQSTVNRWCLDLRMPGPAHMLKIMELTGGHVTPVDFARAMVRASEARAARKVA